VSVETGDKIDSGGYELISIRESDILGALELNQS
jgi:hypothetical protein